MSPQRLHELAAGRGFPKPVYELTVGKLWLRDAIAEYGKTRNRKPGRPDRGTLMRQRVTSALLDAGITAADTRVFMGGDGRAVTLQLITDGSSELRRRFAAKVVAALNSAGLGVSGSTRTGAHADFIHMPEDIEVYLADGHAAEVVELPAA